MKTRKTDTKMKKLIFTETYEAPSIEVLEVQVEQGFATSGNGTIDDGYDETWPEI